MAFTWVLDIQTKVLMPMYQNMIKSPQHVNWCLLYPIFGIPKEKLIMETLGFYLLLFCFVLYGPVVRFLLLFICFYYFNSKASTLQKLLHLCFFWNNTSIPCWPCWHGAKLLREVPESRFSLVFFPAFQSTCCLSQPWTKHITAPEQHGILSYLPAASTVLTSDTSVLSRAGVCQCTVAHAAGLAAALCGNLVWAMRMYCATTSSQCPVAKFYQLSQIGVVASRLYLSLELDLKRKVLAQLCRGFATSIVYLTGFRLIKHSFQ